MSIPASPTPVAARVAPRSGPGFTIALSIAMVLGGGLMALFLLLSSAPGAIVIGAVLASLPLGPVIASYLWLDRYEPEPRSLLLFGIGWGALVATTVALILEVVGEFTLKAPESFGGAVIAPLAEEFAKGLFIVLLLWRRREEIDGVLDGLVYAGMVGVGFAFTENILYLSSAYVGSNEIPGGLPSAVGLFVVRCVFGPFAHPLFTSFTGIGVGLAVVTKKKWVRIVAPIGGYVLAVAAHAAWNGSVFLGGPGAFILTYVCVMVPAFLLLGAFAIWSRRREAAMLSTSLTDCARRGFLDPAEVPWLVRLPARRMARKNAGKVGGPSARKTMEAYQTTAIELGFLHGRYLRGNPPKDFAARGQWYVDELARLRPSLVWPSQRPLPSVPASGVPR